MSSRINHLSPSLLMTKLLIFAPALFPDIAKRNDDGSNRTYNLPKRRRVGAIEVFSGDPQHKGEIRTYQPAEVSQHQDPIGEPCKRHKSSSGR